MRLIFILLIVCLLSCGEKEESATCGCAGPTTISISNARASYLGVRTFVVFYEGDGGQTKRHFLMSCEETDTLKNAADVEKPNYLINADLKIRCETNTYGADGMRITSIQELP